MHLKEELQERGFLKQYTDEALFDIYEKWGNSFYFGVDPSANSMTIGNFVALMQAIHVMLKGNKCYLLVGGATGMIWNPSWKDAERNFLDTDTLAKNQAGIHSDFQRLCNNIQKITKKTLNYEIVNNYDRFKNMNYLEFLREVGKVMTVNRMMNKDIVRNRISDPDKFISYAEFSYMLIMGYDFYVLHRDHNVTLEVGWSDERDGILAGIEITHKLTGNTVYGITNNLILDSNGKKFWKSEGNALWLNPNKNSPYIVYQYFMNATDVDVSRYLKLFTFLDLKEIEDIQAQHNQNPELRLGQKKLAYLVCQIIFSTEEAEQAKLTSEFMFAENKIEVLKGLPEESQRSLAKEVNSKYTNSALYQNTTYEPSDTLIDVLVKFWIVESRWDAKKLIQQWGISVNEQKITDIAYTLQPEEFISGKLILLSKWKKDMFLLFKDHHAMVN